MGTYYFLYRKDNNTAFDLGKSNFATNFGYSVSTKDNILSIIDKEDLLNWVVLAYSYNEFVNPADCLLIRDRLLDFLKGAYKRDVCFIRDESLGDLLERNIYEIVTHDIYINREEISKYVFISNIEEYSKNPLSWFKKNNISKLGSND